MWTDRYTQPAIRAALSPRELIRHELGVLAIQALVLGRTETSMTIESIAADEERFDRFLHDSLGVEAMVGHDVAARLTVLRATTGDDWVGYGLTSSNLVDTALAVGLKLACRVVDSANNSLAQALLSLEAVNDGIGQASRTHGRIAEPGTFPAHAASWYARVQRSGHRLANAEHEIVASLGGPTGRYAVFTRKDAAQVADALLLRLESEPEQAVARDRVATVGTAVVTMATSAAHFATQVRLGATRDELTEPTGVGDYHGSSSMPHKRNPTRSERIVGLERVIRHYGAALAESTVWWDQRDLTASSVERVTIGPLFELTTFVLTEATAIVRGLELDVTTMAANNPASSSNEALWALVSDGRDHDEAYRALRDHDSDPGGV